MQSLEEIIRSSDDLRSSYSEISCLCRKNRCAVIITANGFSDTVLLGYEQYRKIEAKIELLEMLSKAEEDASNGKVSPMQKTFDSLRADLLGKK